jgi:hypothetical protein
MLTVGRSAASDGQESVSSTGRFGEAETAIRGVLSLEFDTYIPIVVALFCAPDGRVQSSTNFCT